MNKKSASQKTVWLVIPSFNDSPRLRTFLPVLCARLETVPLHVWVQVVDDGSSRADQDRAENRHEGQRESGGVVEAQASGAEAMGDDLQ